MSDNNDTVLGEKGEKWEGGPKTEKDSNKEKEGHVGQRDVHSEYKIRKNKK
jgi:hypothetical protein